MHEAIICRLNISFGNNMYFELSENILAVNCINTDIQDRANGMDHDFLKDGSVLRKRSSKNIR